ncbi:AMP-binding protein [Streptomyces avidinii]|uniref:Long-chain acyl-CoA synthetase n=1 Tax=Streptomyces avidinii TaxID=1895 RepID=A0ABS4LEY0_STRAV|nr:AMP-binding protein [Streptomyces avidinii]MBP2040560.1 long-chain acyl-CoA synthetase [Streptomyces avidinii]GGZ30733.1 putative acyl--CoA ligase YhfT [Streptomyces avidinii]
MTIAGGFLSNATQSPDRAALAIGDAAGRRWSYDALRRGALAVARALRAEFGPAPGPGIRVAVLLGNREEFPRIFLGAAVAGIPVMVLDPAWSAAELAAVLSDAPPARLFCESAEGPLARLLPPAALVQVAEGGLEAWLRPYQEQRQEPDRLEGFAEVPHGAPFYVGFTSGSTGRPKGVVRSHRSWLRTFDRYTAEFGIGTGDTVLLPGSLAHSHFLFGLVHGLNAGATVRLMPAFDAGRALDHVERDGVTRLYLVPTMFQALLEHARRQPGRRFPGVRSLLSVGAKWSPASRATAADLFPNADAVEFYGSTELSLVSVLHGDDEGPRESVGRPVAGVELSLRSPSGEEVGVNEPGQVHVRSDMLFTRYLSTDHVEAPDGEGWFTVGDIGRVDERGYLHLVGRKQGMLISGGLNVYPEEVTAALLRLEEIAEAAVVGLPDEHWGDLVCAVVRWRPGARLGLGEVRERASAHVSRQKCPRRLFEADELPHTSSGKIDHGRVRSLLLDGRHGMREVL